MSLGKWPRFLVMRSWEFSDSIEFVTRQELDRTSPQPCPTALSAGQRGQRAVAAGPLSHETCVCAGLRANQPFVCHQLRKSGLEQDSARPRVAIMRDVCEGN